MKIDITDALIVEAKDKIIMIHSSDLSDAAMADIALRLKKAGAIEVIFNETGVELELLSDEDLKVIGLCRMVNYMGEPNGKGKIGKRRKIQGTH